MGQQLRTYYLWAARLQGVEDKRGVWLMVGHMLARHQEEAEAILLERYCGVDRCPYVISDSPLPPVCPPY